MEALSSFIIYNCGNKSTSENKKKIKIFRHTLKCTIQVQYKDSELKLFT